MEITLDSSHIGPTPENNWARFFHDVSHGDGFDVGSGVVSFGFLWQNPSDKAVVVNVHGYLVLDGFCSVFSNGGFIALAFAELNVDADLVIHELWNDPPTSPVAQSTQSQNALTLSCESLGIHRTRLRRRPEFGCWFRSRIRSIHDAPEGDCDVRGLLQPRLVYGRR